MNTILQIYVKSSVLGLLLNAMSLKASVQYQQIEAAPLAQLNQTRVEKSENSLHNLVNASQATPSTRKECSLDKSTRFLYEAIIEKKLSWAIRAIERGANIHAGDENGCTPPHWAAIKVSVELITLLCKLEANVDAVDDKLCTPLHITASHGYHECTSLLLENGAQKGACNLQGKTPLDLATESFHEELAEYMRIF